MVVEVLRPPRVELPRHPPERPGNFWLYGKLPGDLTGIPVLTVTLGSPVPGMPLSRGRNPRRAPAHQLSGTYCYAWFINCIVLKVSPKVT